MKVPGAVLLALYVMFALLEGTITFVLTGAARDGKGAVLPLRVRLWRAVLDGLLWPPHYVRAIFKE